MVNNNDVDIAKVAKLRWRQGGYYAPWRRANHWIEYRISPIKIPRSNNALVDENGEPVDRAITIMGDQNIPYTLLKRINANLRPGRFYQIFSLAVESYWGKNPNGKRDQVLAVVKHELLP